MMITAQEKRRLLVGLSIAFGVLTLAAVGFGFTTMQLLGARAAVVAEPTPTPTATPTKKGPPSATIDGYEISAITDLTAERFALTVGFDGSTKVYTLLTNEDASQAADTSFDVTSYRADGTIVERGSGSVYVQAGASAMLELRLPADLTEVETIVIEQTRLDWSAPDVTGEVTVVAMPGDGDLGVFDVQYTSGLSRPVESVDVYVLVSVDDEIIGVCNGWEDIPASGTSFEGICYWEPAAIEDPVAEGPLPDGVKFEAYVSLDAPEG